MKKKLFLLTAVTILAVSMTACGNEDVKIETEMNGRFETIKEIEVVTPTETPTATEAPIVTVEPTEVPEVEPTIEPTEVPEVEPTIEPTEEPEEDDTNNTSYSVQSVRPSYQSNFGVSVSTPTTDKDPLDELLADQYGEGWNEERFESFISGLDESRYVVAEVDNLDLLFKDGTSQDIKDDVETKVFNPEYWAKDYDYDDIADVNFTGEYHVMTITDTTTNETIVYGVKMTFEVCATPGTFVEVTSWIRTFTFDVERTVGLEHIKEEYWYY